MMAADSWTGVPAWSSTTISSRGLLSGSRTNLRWAVVTGR